jgi:hypothetical protein
MLRLLTLLALTAGCTTQGLPLAQGGASLSAAEGPWRVQIVDGNSQTLPTYDQGPQTWVLGRSGQRYGVRVDNPTANRVEVIVTVDGRDAISGAPGSLSARGYIVEPHGHVMVDGFRTSAQGVAAFRFTHPGDSYAARVGGGANLGVIGVAVFPEQARPEPVQAIARPAPAPPGDGWRGGDARRAPAAESKAGRGAVAETGQADARMRDSAPQALGTQYGERRYSPTVEVEFRRANSTPAAVMAVYYDDHAGLTRRGIIAPAPRGPTPFPAADDQQYAPPPN